jgi:hypothetical protein
MNNDPGIAGALFMAVIALAFIAVGIYIFRTPAQRILQRDRRTGYWIYQRTLKATQDEQYALAAAGQFYKVFGFIFAAMAAGFLMFALTTIIVKLLKG